MYFFSFYINSDNVLFIVLIDPVSDFHMTVISSETATCSTGCDRPANGSDFTDLRASPVHSNYCPLSIVYGFESYSK